MKRGVGELFGSNAPRRAVRARKEDQAGPRVGPAPLRERMLSRPAEPPSVYADVEFFQKEFPFTPGLGDDGGIKLQPDSLQSLAKTLCKSEPLFSSQRHALSHAMMPSTKRLLARHLAGFAVLSDLLLAGAEPLPKADEAVDSSRMQILTGMLRLLPGMPEEENQIWESALHAEDKRVLAQTLSDQIGTIRRGGDAAWIANMTRFAQEFPERVINRIKKEGRFEEQALRDELVRDFGLFDQVLDLLMDATWSALVRRGQGDLPPMGSHATAEQVLSQGYSEFMVHLRQQLQRWFAPEPGQEGEPYPTSESFLESQKRCMEQLSDQDEHTKDAYLDLVFGQWWSVRDALSEDPLEAKLRRAPQDPVPVSFPAADPVSALKETSAAGPAFQVYSEALDFTFTALSDGLELDH